MVTAIEQALVTVRQTLEEAKTPDTKYGLMGAPSVRRQLERLGIAPLPSDSAIQRIMAQHDLTHPIGAGNNSAYYPWPEAWAVNAIHATDIITRYVRGGEEIDNFHTIGMRRGIPVTRLTADMRRLIPREQLPITAGRIHFMRKVDHTGQIAFLNETWPVGPQWVGEYVRATVDTAQQTLTVWHQADADADWQLIKTRQFQLKETAHAVLPQFRRNRTRCRDYWPG